MNKLGSPVNAEYVFDQNEERTLMGSYSEGGKGQSQGLRQVENVYPATPEVFHFSGTDTSMKDITYGHYRYEVEMDIEDNTVKFFQKAFDTMLGLRNQFEMYFEQAKNPQNFQVATNRFKTRFRESTFADLDEIIKGFVHYFNALRFKQGVTANGAEGVNNSYFVTREDVQALLRMSKPMTGSPHSIGLVLNFFDSLLESYSQVLGYNLGASSMSGLDTDVQNLKGHGRKSSSPSAESVRLYHHFREVWDSDIPKNYGYNYLDIESSDLPGINVMSGVSLEERANIEIATYYNEPGEIRIADDKYDLGLYDTEQSKFTFFSPSSVNIGNNQVPLCGEQTFNTEINDTVVGAIAGMNFSFGSPNLNFFLVQQDGAPRSAFGNMLQLSSNASMMNSIVKNDREFSPIVTPQQREEEFNGRTMSADCPPDEPEDRDDVTINEASGPANRPQINIRSISKGKESLARHLSLDAIMAGTGFKANYAVAGNNYRIADPKKGMETVAKERLGYSGINKLMTNVVGMVVHQKMTPLARTKSFSARGGRSGIGSNLGGQQIKNRETRAINKITTGLLRTTGNPKQERNKEIEKLPPQHMSLLAGSKAKVSQEQITVGGQVNPNLAAETFATAILNYHCLGELQFFVGYARKSEHVFMNEPKFERLDRTRLIANSGRRLLCRIVRYEDRQLGFLEPKGLVMPIYDRYFILDVMSGLSDIAAPIDPPTEPTRQETVGNLEIAANQVKAQNVLVTPLEEGAENRENPAWVMAGAASGGAAYLRGAGVGAMTGPARAARQRELAEESERQRQCYLSEHQGFRNEHAQPDTWRWHPGATDWCARANRIEVLTPVEMESCHLWAARVYARSVNCENQYGSLSMKCYDPRHSERYERHKARHGYTRAGNGKCGKRCGEDEVMMFLYGRLRDQKCAYHPYRTFNSRGQRKLIPFHPDEGGY
ncbi:MAG: hypothetical protein VXZ58_01665 [Actinomycetota bacterium]|nr:hypothetical protein [Actinomycetota bacterium]